jgi:glucose-1-phosphate thymidylyltransferase
MEIAKALILVGNGGDDRPWPIAPAGPKQLFPIANRPILLHSLEALRAAGILEATILAEDGMTETFRRAIGHRRECGLTVRYADWSPSGGLRGALAAGHEFLAGEPVLVQEGGALMRDRMHAHISAFARDRLDALAFRFAGRGNASPGYLLSAKAVSILLDDGPEAAGNPVAGVRAHGGRVRVQPVDGCLPCHGDQGGLLESNRHVLERLAPGMTGRSFTDCEVQGPVEIHPTAQIERTLLRGPLIIGPGARITDAYIGPYTSIGADVVIEGTEIEHSIVLPEAELRFVGTRLESSVIGRGAQVRRGFHLPAAMRITIGDGAEIHVR